MQMEYSYSNRILLACLPGCERNCKRYFESPHINKKENSNIMVNSQEYQTESFCEEAGNKKADDK